MCVTCGCSGPGAVLPTDPADKRPGTETAVGWHTHGDGTSHTHEHEAAPGSAHSHAHEHGPGPGPAHGHGADPPSGKDEAAAQLARQHGRTITLEQDLLAKNQLLAERNRGWFAGRGVLALNLVSSPGSGKTSVLERSIRDLAGRVVIGVVEGDQATLNDAQRIRAAGADAVQINTGTGCHLDADMVARGLTELQPARGSVVMIENVGNLVCPALFDLGEHAKVLVLSVTEGEDKPLKYPHMFRAASLLLLNKIDLLPHLRFDVDRCIAYARQINPDIEILQVSAQTGDGMPAWYQWMTTRLARAVTTGTPASAPGPRPVHA